MALRLEFFQISFPVLLNELLISYCHLPVIYVLISDEIARNLPPDFADRNAFLNFEIDNSYGIFGLGNKLKQHIKSSCAVFTIFGPLYKITGSFNSLVGFAQPWIVYPNNECYKNLNFIQRLTARLKFKIQSFYFKRSHKLIVELDHVKRRMISQLGVESVKIEVVPNALSSIFTNHNLWMPLNFPPADGFLRLGFLGRNYVHKNTNIFPGIAMELNRAYGIRSRFYVTFTDDEWNSCTPEFRSVCINIGPILTTQCPGFYQNLDAVVFPSLLECFSVTPLESMSMEIPLFASDRPFNRDICGPHAHYFDPLDPLSAARAIGDLFSKGGANKEALRSAREHAINFSNSKTRAMKYLDLLLKKKCD